MRSLFRLVVVTAFAGVAATACDRDSPVLPSTRPTALTIVGPASVPPGGTAQFRATVRYFDGTISDVTAEATWTSYDPAILEMRPGGLAVGKSRGPAAIAVRHDSTPSIQTLRILVTEDGTFELSGRVIDADTGAAVAKAVITTEGGAGPELSATTDGKGQYVLFGVGGNVRLRVLAAGYVPWTRDVTVSTSTVQNIDLSPMPSTANLSGSWTLTMTAPASCQLPDDARTRQFTITIDHQGLHLTADFSSPSLARTLSFKGRMIGDAVTLVIPTDGDWDYYSYILLDALIPAGFLGIEGTIRASGDDQRIDGVLEGTLAYYPGAVSAGGGRSCFGKSTVSLRRR